MVRLLVTRNGALVNSGITADGPMTAPTIPITPSGMAALGGTTPLVAAWLVSRTGVPLAPAMYLTAAAALTSVGALLLPKTPPYRLTKEFEAARSHPPTASN